MIRASDPWSLAAGQAADPGRRKPAPKAANAALCPSSRQFCTRIRYRLRPVTCIRTDHLAASHLCHARRPLRKSVYRTKYVDRNATASGSQSHHRAHALKFNTKPTLYRQTSHFTAQQETLADTRLRVDRRGLLLYYTCYTLANFCVAPPTHVLSVRAAPLAAVAAVRHF